MPVTNYYTVNGEIIGEKTTGSPRIDYLTDALGSVMATVNQSAQVVNTYRYKPFGGLLAKTGAAADPSFQWVGSQGYRQTGKKYSDVYVRARHYDTRAGRWTTQDPWRFSSGDFNVYGYGRSRPADAIDPSGLQCACKEPFERLHGADRAGRGAGRACCAAGVPAAPRCVQWGRLRRGGGDPCLPAWSSPRPCRSRLGNGGERPESRSRSARSLAERSTARLVFRSPSMNRA